jgi:hypothetical protein
MRVWVVMDAVAHGRCSKEGDSGRTWEGTVIEYVSSHIISMEADMKYYVLILEASMKADTKSLWLEDP